MEELEVLKEVNLNPVIPFLKMTPEALIALAWASIPGMAVGVFVASILIYLRVLGQRMKQPEKSIGWWGFMAWPLYVLGYLGVWYLLALGVSISAGIAPIAPEAKKAVATVFQILTIIQGALLASSVFSDICSGYLRRTRADGSKKLMVNTLLTVARLLFWAIAIVLILNALGVNVTALVAGLGLGGVAIAFAMKNIVENILASFSMVLSPPFVIGDFIEVGDVKGSVEEITLKNVLIRGVGGEQWVVPSGDMLNSKVRNMSRLRQRRKDVRFGVGYATVNAAKLKRIPEIIQKAIESHGDMVRFDYAHLIGFGDNSVNFEAVYFVLSADGNLAMKIHEQVLSDIYEGLEGIGVNMALNFRGTAADLQGAAALLGGEGEALKKRGKD